jgi:hypothetical protein
LKALDDVDINRTLENIAENIKVPIGKTPG